MNQRTTLPAKWIGFLFLALIALSRAFAADPVRVACLGDSITAGARVNAETEAYPVYLQQFLGEGFEVRNFGKGGATMWHGSKLNAISQLPPAAAFLPRIAVVMFGINDTRSAGVDYWDHFEEFEADAMALLDGLLALASKPRIILCLPTASITHMPGMTAERTAVLVERLPRLQTVREKLEKIAARYTDRGVELVDMEAVTAGKPAMFNADGVHFNPSGYRMLAEVLKPRVEALARAK